MRLEQRFAANADPDAVNARMNSQACVTVKIGQRCFAEFYLSAANFRQDGDSQRMLTALFDRAARLSNRD
jgi:hypothetical protein